MSALVTCRGQHASHAANDRQTDRTDRRRRSASDPKAERALFSASSFAVFIHPCTVIVMHITVPYTEQKVDESGREKHPYTVYHIYINGAFHCAQRYSQLRSLYEKVSAKGFVFVPADVAIARLG